MYKALQTIYDKYGVLIRKDAVFSEDRLTHSHLFRLLKSGQIERANVAELVPFEGDVKLCVVTAMWQRPEVFKIFGEHYQKLGLDVICVGSEGSKSKKLVESYGFIYLERPNNPLGAKMNATITEAMKRGYTHIICVGSDDLITKDLVDEYLKLIKEGYHFIGLLDFYFYELESGKAIYWGGYNDKRIGKTIGAGRVLSAEIINSLGGKVWNDNDNRYLDKGMQERLSVSNLPQKVFKLKDKGMIAVDLKSSDNITPFAKWRNSHYISSKIITDCFGYLRD